MSRFVFHAKLSTAILIAFMAAACSGERHRAKKSGATSSFRPPAKMEMSTTPSDPDRAFPLDDETLDALPSLVGAPHQVNAEILQELGIPADQSPEIVQAIQRSYAEARQLRDQATRSLRYEVDTPVRIPPLSDEEITAISERFSAEISSLKEAHADAGFMEIEILLRAQLIKEFGRPIEVTLIRSDDWRGDTTYVLQTPAKYRGLYFQIKVWKDNGSVRTFTVNPVQYEFSEYFYLNLDR